MFDFTCVFRRDTGKRFERKKPEETRREKSIPSEFQNLTQRESENLIHSKQWNYRSEAAYLSKVPDRKL
jgi:hypothetical protein